MKYWRLVGGSVTFTSLIVSASSAIALDLTIQPRVSIGSQYYEFNVDGNSDVNSEVTYAFGGLGVTGQLGNFFLDLYGQTNLTEGEDDVVVRGSDRETTVDRNELNLTAGFAFTRYVTAFGGLKYAKNNIDSEFANDVTTSIDDVTIDIEASYFGPFAGLAVAFPISDFGALSLNGSLAYLDGEEKIDNTSITGGTIVNEGKSVGYALGLGWSGRFGPSTSALGYGVGLDYSAYNFEEDGEDVFDEKTLRLRGDLKYRF